MQPAQLGGDFVLSVHMTDRVPPSGLRGTTAAADATLPSTEKLDNQTMWTWWKRTAELCSSGGTLQY